MRRRIIVTGLILGLVLALLIPFSLGWAATEGTVTCTVSASQVISVTVSDGSVNYGTVALNTTWNTTSSQANDKQTATNNGSGPEKLSIKSSNASGASGGWNLGGVRGESQFTHKFSLDNGTTWTAMTTNYQVMVASIAAGTSQTFDLEIGMPTSVTDYTQKTITVTILAEAL